jgi:hypothetical protein
MVRLMLDYPAQPALEIPLYALALDVAVADRDPLGATNLTAVVRH